ncbi:glutathione S-transferase family protein [Paludibacterium sp.]|uniref:glutathione S-transferase family protein n=1 Tax=Paludibacterium sp. TaxID=1917523 RepID=UPI0025CE588A|nr:glutathione S-transferase family protein [Paludibacterium sp.]MBV8649658.1 glutathione S-transferase family protein [Paludibacterium sp.]
MFTLFIGSKNLSSWSLRPWLVLKMLDEPFEEQLIDLTAPGASQKILAINPAGKVPLLHDRHLKIWDSLAICEYLAECFPHAELWPVGNAERAHARSVVAEMHSGFPLVRQAMPMDICGQHPTPPLTTPLQREIDRILTIWIELRQEHVADGPFLFGHFTIADAFFAPVVTRFNSYQYPLTGLAADYADHMLALPAMQQWAEAAKAETALAC